MASSLVERLSRFLTRAGKCDRYAVSVGGELVAEVPAGDGALDELVSAAEDAAAARQSRVTAVFRAYRGDAPACSLTAVVEPPRPQGTGDELSRVIAVLTRHAEELTRLVIQSQAALLQAYQSAVRDAARRAAEAEARAAAAEELAAAAQQPELPPVLTQLLASLPSLAGAGEPNGGSS